MHRIQELIRLHRLGHGCRQVAQMLRMSPKTEREYRQAVEQAGLLTGDPGDLPRREELRAAVEKVKPPRRPPQQRSTVEPWRGQIEDMILRQATPKAIFDCLRLEDPDFEGSYDAVKRMCARIAKERGVQSGDIAIPVVTAPGQVAQVDFGYAGKLFDPVEQRFRRAWVFVMVLGHCRHMFARVVFDQKTPTWLALHVDAFNFFGGAPAQLVPDRLKAAVVKSAFGVDGDTMLNRSYQELARHYGCVVDPTPPRSPKKKGKVESSVKYVKRSYFKPRDLSTLDIRKVNRGLRQWVMEIAGQRIHGTTGKRPLVVFEEEEAVALRSLPPLPFEPIEWKKAKVHTDAHIVFDKRMYSVPWTFMGSDVEVRATQKAVAIYAGEERIATHDRSGTSCWSTLDAHLPECRADYRHRSRTYWEGKARAMGEDVLQYVQEVFDAEDVKSNLRAVQAIVSHLRLYPVERAQAACRRASFFGNHTLQGIKNILRKALDLEPLPTLFSDATDLKRARYARRPSCFQRLNTKEDTHGRL
jgi:transposase